VRGSSSYWEFTNILDEGFYESIESCDDETLYTKFLHYLSEYYKTRLLDVAHLLESDDPIVATVDFFNLNFSDIIPDAVKCLFESNKVYVYADYDCDGISSAYLLHEFYNNLLGKVEGSDIQYDFPSRIKEGYGLSSRAVQQIAKFRPDLLILADVGVKEINNIQTLLQADAVKQVIIIDHHHMEDQGQSLSSDSRIFLFHNERFNHRLEGAKSLSAGALTWLFLTMCLAKYDRPETAYQYAQKYVDIAALSIIGDIVPLVGLNFILVRSGLLKIKAGLNCHPVFNRVKYDKNLDNNTIAFNVVPMINAPGRLGNSRLAFEYLIDPNAKERDILKENERRKKTQAEAFEKLKAEIDVSPSKNKTAIVHISAVADAGLLGLLANMLAEEYKKPVFLLNDSGGESLKGSYRHHSQADYNIIDWAADHSHIFKEYGGHSAVLGFVIDKKYIPALCEKAGRITEYRIASPIHASFPSRLISVLPRYETHFLEFLEKLYPLIVNKSLPLNIYLSGLTYYGNIEDGILLDSAGGRLYYEKVNSRISLPNNAKVDLVARIKLNADLPAKNATDIRNVIPKIQILDVAYVDNV